MNTTEHRVLEYVHGIKGGPTRAQFDVLHGPAGALLLPKMVNVGLLRIDVSGRLHLTAAGIAGLKS